MTRDSVELIQVKIQDSHISKVAEQIPKYYVFIKQYFMICMQKQFPLYNF